MRYWFMRIRRWMRRQDIWMKLFALLVSVLLWNFIMNDKNPLRTLNYSVPVKLTGVEQLYNIYGLSVVEGGESNVTVRVSAPSSRIANLTASQINVEADLSSVITEPGEYEIHYTVSLPESNMTCQRVSPQTIKVIVDRTEKKSIPVEVKTVGKQGEGYRYGEITTDVKTVNITGPESYVEQIDAALVKVDADQLTETTETRCDYILVDEQGHEIEQDHIVKETMRVTVRIPVERIKSVPLKVQLTPESSAASASVAIEPSSVEIVGDPQAVEAIDSIVIGSMNVDHAQNGDSMEFTITLPQGVQLTDGQPTTAHATLRMDSTSERTIRVSDIQLQDEATDSETTATLLTESLDVKVSGGSSAVQAMQASDVKIVVAINSQELSVGTHQIGVQVETPDGITVIGNYSVSVKIE